jgi:protein-S-isoprenylcysteine O-methyltransferase Ste14
MKSNAMNPRAAQRPQRRKSPPVLALIPPPIWALFYLVVVFVFQDIGILNAPPLLYEPILGAILGLAGIALALAAYIEFRKAGTAVAPTAQVNSELVTDGIYARSRNPMYLGLVLITLGVGFMQGQIYWLAVPLIVFLTNNFVVIPYEEAKMRRQFPGAFEAYCRKTRRWL